LPKFISVPLEQFGLATYGIYLLHPLVFFYSSSFLRKFGFGDPVFLFIVTVLFTLLASLLSYNLFEVKMLKISKKLTTPQQDKICQL
jgi:peptidoglycan/LPS O-acetylase OafA/YrhL